MLRWTGFGAVIGGLTLIAGFIGFEILLNTAPVLAAPNHLQRPMLTEITYYLIGGQYQVSLTCPGEPDHRIHRLRADDHVEAAGFLTDRLPDCRIDEIRRDRHRFKIFN